MNKHELYFTIGDLKIYEPGSIITSIVISLLCMIFFLALTRKAAIGYVKAWRFFFLFLAVSSLLGCFYHGIQKQWGENTENYFNLSRNICSLLAAFFSLRGTLLFVQKNPDKLKKLNTILLIYILIAIAVTIVLNKFVIVIISAGIFILYTLVAHIRAYRLGVKSSKWILWAFGISPFPIAIHLFKLGINEYLTAKDLAHVFIWISLYFIYRGVRESTLEVKKNPPLSSEGF